MSTTLELRGFDEALEALDFDVEGLLGLVLDRILPLGQEHARAHTPVVSGAMRGAWHWHRSGVEGVMGIDPSAINPRSGGPVSAYAPTVDARLGIVDGALQRMTLGDMDEVGWEE